MDKCTGCFKPAFDETACAKCTFIESSKILADFAHDAAAVLGGLSPELIDEARYELMCHLPQRSAQEARNMGMSDVAAIISRCADSAIYLSRKRFEENDDLKAIIFSPDTNDAYITNGDVCIRLSDFHPNVLAPIDCDLPVYDYLLERFVPNTLPYTVQDMDNAFISEFAYSIPLPVHPLLDWMHHRYPDAVERRNTYTTIDVGYGFVEGSVIVPRFQCIDDTRHTALLGNGMQVFVSKSSIIPDAALETNCAYVGTIENQKDGTVVLNVYKKYEGYVNLGLYETLDNPVEDDLHPFDFENYADNDRVKIVLEQGPVEMDLFTTMQTFKTFQPLALDTDNLYYTLLIYVAFGVNNVYLHVRNNTCEPVLMEGIRVGPDEPTIEAVIATAIVGEPGKHCEEILIGKGN